MRYSIHQLDATTWELRCDERGIGTFASYDLAVASLGSVITADLAVAIEALDGQAAAGDGLLPEGFVSPALAVSEKLPMGRDFSATQWSWRDPNASLVPLLFQPKNAGHEGADLVGFFTEFGMDGTTVTARGRFYDNEAAREARTVLLDGRPFGVSVDPTEHYEVELDVTCTEYDGEGFCVAADESYKFLTYEIGGATMHPIQGFDKAQVLLDPNPSAAPAMPEPVRAASKPKGEPARAMMTLAEPKPGMPFLDKTGDDVLVEQLGRNGDVLAFATPLTITDPMDDGYRYVYGHATWWGQCHSGNPWGPGLCAAASPSENGYRDFLASGTVKCDDGSEIPIGRLVVGCEHSDKMNAGDIRDHLAHAGMGWASVNVVDGDFGPWVSGVLDSTLTDDQIRLLRSLSMSGEWVRELGGILSVNASGFPVQREKIAASFGAGEQFTIPQAALRASVKGGEVTKLVGGNLVRACPECQKRARLAASANGNGQLDRIEAALTRLDLRTKHLIGAEATAVRERLAASAGGGGNGRAMGGRGSTGGA